MNKLRALRLSLCAALVCATLSVCAGAKADTWDKKTIVTFNEPVEVPGWVLPAGTYVFKLAPSNTDRHIVQIFNEDETQLVTTIMAIPTYRLEPSGKSVFTFDERSGGSPQALHAWFYPGDDTGNEFAYPQREYPQNGYDNQDSNR